MSTSLGIIEYIDIYMYSICIDNIINIHTINTLKYSNSNPDN